VRVMLCGLVGSLPTVTAMMALSEEPPAVGVNVTAIVHEELGDTIGPQVPLPVTEKSVAFVPLMLSLSGSANPERLVTVVFSVFDGTFVVSVPYASVAGRTVAGIVGPVVIATGLGLSGSGLSATDSVADSVPSALGEKLTIIEHDVSASRVVPQVPPLTEKSEGLAPLKDSLRATGWL